MTSPAATPAQLFCSWCGTAADELPLTWTVQTALGGLEYLCADCTRANVRQIETQLPAEWWH